LTVPLDISKLKNQIDAPFIYNIPPDDGLQICPKDVEVD